MQILVGAALCAAAAALTACGSSEPAEKPGDGGSSDAHADAPADAPVDAPPIDAGSETDSPVDAPDTGPAPNNACAPLALEAGVSVDGFLSDRFTWQDVDCKPRSAAMVRNDGADPTGHFGGYLRQIVYTTGGETRTINGSSDTHPGWGYTVNHFGNGGSSSSSSRDTQGTWSTLLAGRHHAIHEYHWFHPIDGHDVEITIQWLFATGRDHPLWAITFDTSAAGANAVNADTRAPYGDLQWDGGANADVAGVGWGDRYKFVSLASPISLASGWDYSQSNLVPYAMEWTDTPDAEMGSVQTQTWMEHDAGGYWNYSTWGTKSASGPMPQDFDWTYQLNQYELPFPGGQKSKRLAWGANTGAVGQSSYNAYGDDKQLSGYPYQSYSVFMVLGRHSTAAVAAEVADVETVQHTHLTADVGSVWTTGPAGIARTDTTTLDPVGWDARYATWNVDSAGNHARVTMTVDAGAGPLVDPILVVHGYSAAAPPAVKLDGATLVPDADYFLTLDAAAKQLWVTLRRAVSGAHTLEIQ